MSKAMFVIDDWSGKCDGCGFSAPDGDRCFLVGEDIDEDTHFGGRKLDGCPIEPYPEDIGG